MNSEVDHKEFSSEVLAAEKTEIQKRRKNVAALSGSSSNLSNSDLIGLSCSGGGIRSASFSLGIIQFLIQQDLFKKIDYLSTVSGGGYIGSCISSLTKDEPGKEKLLTDRVNNEEPAALNYLRNYSRYLSSEGKNSRLRIPVLIIEGAIRSFFTFFPIIIFAVLGTELFFEITGQFSKIIQWATPILCTVPLFIHLALRPVFINRLDWQGRERSDRLLTTFTLYAMIAIIAVPLLAILRTAVELDSQGFTEYIVKSLINYKNYLLPLIASSILLLTIFVIKKKVNLAVLLVSIIAPLSLFLLYIYLCIVAINSPYIDQDSLHNVKDIQKEVFTEETLLVTKILNLTKPKATHSKTLTQTEKSQDKQCNQALSETPEYLSVKDDIEKSFKTKQIVFSDYCLSNISTNKLTYRHLNDKLHQDLFSTDVKNYLTTSSPPTLTLSIISEYITNTPMLVFEELRALRGHAEWWLYLIGLILQIYNLIFININRFSLHSFYRDKLSRTFIIQSDNGKITTADKLKMSSLNGENSTAPYHIINTALNLQGSDNPQLRSRKTTSFIITKHFCGCDLTGYSKTKDMEKEDKNFDLAAAMAISAAAASPNMGTVGNKSFSFIMTLLNIRLNYWLPNPSALEKGVFKKPSLFNPLGLSYLMSEALATVNEKTPYINCSDGGHIENLGAYELLRRQCKTIVCIDAEADKNFIFDGLTTLQRYAEIDLGIVIDLDIKPTRPVDGFSKSNYAVGSIYYPDKTVGTIIYLKLSFTSKVAEYLNNYKNKNPEFPHESTSDQDFGETQFEVYRALGNFVAQSASQELHQFLLEKKSYTEEAHK